MKGQRAHGRGNQRLSKRASDCNERQKWGQVCSEPKWGGRFSIWRHLRAFSSKHFISKSTAVRLQMPEESLCLGDFLVVNQKKHASSHLWQTKTKIVGSYLWSLLTVYEHSVSPPRFFKPNICFLYICRHVGKKKVNREPSENPDAERRVSKVLSVETVNY